VNITTSKTQPAIIGGLVMGVLSALPIISAGNICCCLWVVSGGVVAAYLLQQNQHAPITPGDGAVVGLLAGLIGALVQFVISIPIGILVAPMERAIVQRMVEAAGNMPPAMREMFEGYLEQSGQPTIVAVVFRRLVELCLMLVAGAVFSTLGGLLGAAIFRKQLPGPTEAPPPPI
jgi:hypothetical protein